MVFKPPALIRPITRLLVLLIVGQNIASIAEEPSVQSTAQPSARIAPPLQSTRTPHRKAPKKSRIPASPTAPHDRARSTQWLERSVNAVHFPTDRQNNGQNRETRAVLNPRCRLTRAGLQIYTRRDQDRFSNYSTSQSTVALGFFEVHKKPDRSLPPLTQTELTECLKEWGFVQWVRGCVVGTSYGPAQLEALPDGTYSSEYPANAPPVYQITGDHVYNRQGTHVPFYFLDWIVDSVDVDPLYWSASPPKDRHASHRFVPGRNIGQAPDLRTMTRDLSFTNRSSGYLRFEDLESQDLQAREAQAPQSGSSRSLQNQLYVRDTPNIFSLTPRDRNHTPDGVRLPEGRVYAQVATQIALEFKLCLHRASEVPREGLPARFDVAPETPGAPLHCWDWSSNAVFDFTTQQFKRVDPVSYCRENPPNPVAQ